MIITSTETKVVRLPLISESTCPARIFRELVTDKIKMGIATGNPSTAIRLPWLEAPEEIEDTMVKALESPTMAKNMLRTNSPGDWIS